MKILLLLIFLQGISAFSQEDNAFVSDTSFYPVKHNKVWYFMDTSGAVHEEKPHFSSVYPVYFFAEVYYVVNENGKYGMLRQNLEQFQEIKYDTIISNPYYLLLKEGKTWTYYLFNESITMEADSVFQDGENVYYYKNGKTGLIASGMLICKPEYERIASMNTLKGFFLTYQAGKFGLINQKGEIMLPAEYAEIQEFDYGFVKFRKNESWKYYHTTYKNTIDPAGKDIHFYNDQCWKIYNGDRSQSVLYLDGGKRSLSGKYDDYFLLGNGKIAVRKNGKIGLLDENGQLLIAPKYEQIERVDNDFYQYKQKDLWGLMVANGKEITPAVYNHFLPAKNYDNQFYFVLKNGSCGLMTKEGKIIIPIEYDYIFFLNDFYLLQLDGKFGMANLEGKILSPCIYPAYDIVKGRNSSNLLCVFQKNNQFTVFSKYGKINASPCHDFVYENDVLKCYGENYVEVYVLSADGKQEDYHRYDGIQSFTFINSYSNWYRKSAGLFNESYLEENQQNGLFGLRFLQKEGMAVASTFKYVRETDYLDIYTAHEETDKIRFDKFGNAALETSEGAYLMWTKNASIQKDLILNTEAFNYLYQGGSTESAMKMNRDFSMRWISTNSKYFPESKLVAEAIYMDRTEDYKRIYFGGKAEFCALNESDVSATEYFHYMNQMRNFWFTDAASAKIFMDPQLGVRFTGGEWKVLRVTEYFDQRPKIEFKTDQSFNTFKQFVFIDQYLFEETGSGNLQFVDVWNDTTKLEHLEKIDRVESFGGEEAYLISQYTNGQGKVNISNPDFIFEPDSEQTDYIDRWIVSKKNGKYGLRAPNGEMLVSHDFQEIKYLGEHWFGISSSSENWLMINSRSGSFADSSFTSLGFFNNGFLPFTQEKSSGLIDSKGVVIARCENCKFEISGGLILMKEADRTVVSDEIGVVIATLAQGETLLGSDFILSKDKRGSYQVKPIETNAIIPLKTLKTPEVFGECLVVQNGNYYSLLRNDGTFAAKKSDLYEKYSNGIIGFRFSKKWQFYNLRGKQVHVSGSVKNRIVQEDLLMLDEKGKPYFIDNSGKVYASDSLFKPIREQKKQEINTEYELFQPQANGYSLVQKAGKWGALDSTGKLVIPCVHSELSYLGNDEFSVSLNGKQTFANTALKLILPAQYDEIFIVSDEFYMVRNGNRFGYLRKDGTWLREME